MADDDVLEIGPPGRRWSRRLLIAVAVAVLVTVLVVRAERPRGRSAGPRPPTSASAQPSTPPSAAGPATAVTRSPEVDQEYLIAVPAQDMAATLRTGRCRAGCTAHQLAGAALDRAGRGFAGLAPLAGGTVTDAHGAVVLRTIEALARPDALVHLLVERVPFADAALRTTDSLGSPARTVVLALIRDGFRFTATLVVRGTEPPVAAATTWARTVPLPL